MIPQPGEKRRRVGDRLPAQPPRSQLHRLGGNTAGGGVLDAADPDDPVDLVDPVMAGQLTVAAKWPGGQGALVSVVALSTGQDPKMNMVLLGGRGAVYFET